MRNALKKVLSLMLLTWLLAGNFSFATAAVVNVKAKKLSALSKKLQTHIEKDINKNIIKLKNTKDKAAYKSELAWMSSLLSWLSVQMQNGNDENFNLYMEQLRSEAKQYVKMKKEIASYISTWESPFIIDTADIRQVEADIVWIQREVVSVIREKIKDFNWDSFKETWKMNFSIVTDFWKVGVNIERYTNIMALITLSQELDFTIDISVDLNVPWEVKYVNNKVVKWPNVNLKWNAKFDVNFKVIDKDIYATLKDYSVTIASSVKDASFESQIASLEKALEPYKGKTIHMKVPDRWPSSLNQAEVMDKLNKTLDILDKYPLLTTYKKLPEWWFSLIPKEATVMNLNNLYNAKKITPSEVAKGIKEAIKNPLIYSSKDWILTLTSDVTDSSWIFKSVLTRKDWKYSFQSNWKINPVNWMNDFDLYLEKNVIKFNSTSKNDYVKIIYENKNLILDSKAENHTLKITWPLSEENTDLVIVFDNKSVWSIKSTRTWTKVTFDINLTFEVPANTIPSEMDTSTVKFILSWDYDHETWEFSVIKPKTFIELESIVNR
ncbi:MAG: hypothetical protein ACD_3C00140G0004 [uncultured bacterium (gcode 4)]|uniref:Uncharacterized protein n=1 Tax=uncultured bacterium (gcode 4) TaxID=1234023 RepID=K2G110_9BACT|nr:MAG: hypothetical protein ACD_3C00140G0004 [uncultured bacterium (gcode 4)]